MNSNKKPPIALVTGATGAIGQAIARQLAERGYETVLACRDAHKAQTTVTDIIQSTGNSRIRYELVDLSNHSSIQDLATRWQGPLKVLINVAADTPRQRQETSEGIERQFATNVLGYFWMMAAFTEHLKHSAPARIVNVASYWAGGLDLNDLEFKHRRYDNDEAYRQSKQANRMLTVAFAERLQPFQIAVNACHPGDVHSNLSHSLGFGGHETPDQGASTPIWLATEAVGQTRSGAYFEHKREVKCSFATERHAVATLYKICQSYR